MSNISRVSLGFLGCGTVGEALVDLIAKQADSIQHRSGISLEVVAIGVSSTKKPRSDFIDPNLLTTDLERIVQSEDIDLVVELMGGIDPAKELLLTALKNSKPVVTANKELIASHGAELFTTALEGGTHLAFEAAVAGAIPIVRTLKESLAGESITRISGILNGTTNYVLSAMTDDNVSYDDALKKAQDLGYAERDPTNDVSGSDAAAKIAILASIAFGGNIGLSQVHYEGIEPLDREDITYAGHLGYTLKLLAIAEKLDGGLAIRVHPTMVPNSHQLATVSGSYNAVFVEGDTVGELMLYGHGAGGAPTASAVLGDILDLSANLEIEPSSLQESSQALPTILKMSELTSAFYLRLEVDDTSGVLASVAEAFGKNGVSIRSMEQDMENDNKQGLARLVFITHTAKEKDFRATLADLENLGSVKNIATSLRVGV